MWGCIRASITGRAGRRGNAQQVQAVWPAGCCAARPQRPRQPVEAGLPWAARVGHCPACSACSPAGTATWVHAQQLAFGGPGTAHSSPGPTHPASLVSQLHLQQPRVDGIPGGQVGPRLGLRQWKRSRGRRAGQACQELEAARSARTSDDALRALGVTCRDCSLSSKPTLRRAGSQGTEGGGGRGGNGGLERLPCAAAPASCSTCRPWH